MSRSKKNVLRLVCVGVSLVALMGIPAFAADEEASDPNEKGTMGSLLLGSVISIEGDQYIIRDEEGRTAPYHVSKDSKLNDSGFAAGDQVIGSVTPEGHVIALTKRFSTKVGA